MAKNFPALAADQGECYRHRMVKSEEGCALLLAAYHDSRNLQRMEWAAQACMDAGRETPEVYLGLAAAEEAAGRDLAALQRLLEAEKKFPQKAEVYLRMATIFKRNKRVDEAAQSYHKVVELLPQNADMTLEAFRYFVSVEKWADAKKMVDRLQAVQGVPVELKFLMARALFKFGDQASARLMAEEGRKMLGRDSSALSAFKQTYPELF
jgi:tetratricopeptide (TPR) repeat protein